MNEENKLSPVGAESPNPLPVAPTASPNENTLSSSTPPDRLPNTPPLEELAPPKKKLQATIWTILGLLFLPLVGIMTMWVATTWKRPLKIILTVVAGLYLPIHILLFFYYGFAFVYAGGNIQPFLPQDKFAQTYLRDRYNEEFVIGKSLGGDALGSSITYHKLVSPKSDPTLEFVISKCLARCDLRESTDFKDNYYNVVWKKQQSDKVTHFMNSSGLRGNFSVSVDAKVGSVIDDKTKKMISFDSLPASVKRTAGYEIDYYERNGTYTYENRAQHAEAILKLARYLDDLNVHRSHIKYEIDATVRNGAKSIKEQEYVLDADPSSLLTREDVYRAFILTPFSDNVSTRKPSAKGATPAEPSKCQQALTGNPKAGVEISGEAATIEKYLATKYGINATVRDCYMIISNNEKGALANYAIIGDIFLKEHFYFGITKTIDDSGEVHYTDNYLEAKWSKEGRDEVQRLLSPQYLVTPEFGLTITPTQGMIDAVNGSVPAFPKVKPQMAADVGYDLTVINYANATIAMSAEEHYERVVTIAQYLVAHHPKANLTYVSDYGECAVSSAQLPLIKTPANAQACLK
jgi:hypothetical protein